MILHYLPPGRLNRRFLSFRTPLRFVYLVIRSVACSLRRVSPPFKSLADVVEEGPSTGSFPAVELNFESDPLSLLISSSNPSASSSSSLLSEPGPNRISLPRHSPVLGTTTPGCRFLQPHLPVPLPPHSLVAFLS